MRRNLINVTIGVFAVIFIMATLSLAEDVSTQAPKKSKSRKQTTSKEKASTAPVKKDTGAPKITRENCPQFLPNSEGRNTTSARISDVSY